MKKFACRYAVVQFAPHAETGEFANVGVAVMCPETGYFGFQLQTRKHKRVTDFFDELPRHVYLRAVQLIRGELARIEKIAAIAPETGRADFLRHVFDGLVHPREAIIRFSPPRFRLTDDPAAEVKRLFDHYVDRAFATQEYVEQGMERRLKAMLATLELPLPFKPAKVGDDEVYANFQLVQWRGDKPGKIIKPFNLSQAEPMGIYDHGDTWVQKIRRLRKRNTLPANVLFALSPPPVTDVKRYKAFTEIKAELEAEQVVTVQESDQDKIAGFALSAVE